MVEQKPLKTHQRATVTQGDMFVHYNEHGHCRLF